MKIIEHFFGLLAPHDCLICGHEGSLLCIVCASKVLKPIPERCYRCYRITPSNITCAICRNYSVLKHVWVRTEYNEAAKKLVYAFKFNFAQDAAKQIAQELQKTVPSLIKDMIIVHLPAATSHVRQRGFDQSALIARELSYLTGYPHIHALSRIGQQRQVGANVSQRKQQMKHAYRCVSEAAVKDASILLVDDVLTTGSTLEAAALTLRQAGAKTVSAVAFAQAK